MELVRRSHEALTREGPNGPKAAQVLAESLHPDAAWHDQRELPGATVHRGIEAIRRHLEDAQRDLAYDVELLELIDAGQHVVAAYSMRARGRLSGVPVERYTAWTYTFRGRKIERVEIFATKEEALEAAGLEE